MRKTQSWLAIGALFVVAACGDSGPLPPGAVSAQVTTNADTVTVTWASATEATSYRVELRAASDTLQANATDAATATFTSADGLEDAVLYTAVVFSVNEGGETASSNSPQVLTDFFPWDEHFETALHATGQGKQTFYNTTPNRGFERFTNVSYDNLSCKNCHEPASTGGCEACHATATPTLGDDVDATLTGVCGNCHGRQKAEALVQGYSDVHRDAGMDCMACHTLEDMHGDGTAYASMLDEGAIDADCETCHSSLASNTYHDTHASTVDCSACHIQSVVTCYNCHFETELQLDQKKAYGQFKDWLFLINYEGKVTAANFQSVKYGDNTFLAFAPFYAHTIARNARTCSDCHNNAAVQDYVADGVIDVVTWDAGQGALSYLQGVIPIPPDYLTAMRFDFVDLDQPGGSIWSFLETGPDSIQMVYGTPLTQAQMDRLQQ